MAPADDSQAPLQHDSLDGFPAPAEAGPPIGHDAVWHRLTGLYRDGRLPHALILTGPAGIGKSTLAHHFARYLFTHADPSAAPDGGPEFPVPDTVRRQVASGAHPGILHIARPYNAKTKSFRSRITVDEIRAVGRFLSHTSHDGSYRVVIVDPAEDMNVNAANALLKVLEEPPRGTIFLLLSHQPGRLLPTIRSRCQIVRMAPLDGAAIGEALARLGQPLPDALSMEALQDLSEGSVRRTLQLLAFGGLDVVRAVDDLVRAGRFDLAEAERAAAAVGGRGADESFDQFNRHALDRLARQAHDLAMAGDAAAASTIAVAHDALRTATDEVMIYNLDRRHHALSTLRTLHGLLAAG